MIADADRLPTISMESLRERFVVVLLPRIMTHASIVFRGQNEDQKAELTADAIALGWSRFIRLYARGKDAAKFPAVFATIVVRGVKCGRRLNGMEKARDVLSTRAQQRHGFRVDRLPATTRVPLDALYGAVGGQRLHDEFEERLRDNTVTPPPDQAQFRIDWSAFLGTLTGRELRMIRVMSLGERTQNLSKQFEMSPGRVSQLRREFERGWKRFVGDLPATSSK